MDNRKNWKMIVLRSASYIVVAALASLATFFAFDLQPTKLERLQALIEERFIGEVDVTAIEDAAAESMVDALGDRWSYYVSAQEYTAHKERKENAYVGIGITIQVREDNTGFDIIQVEPEGPAQKAGILPGDILIEAEGQDLIPLGVSGAGEIIGGREGTKVTVTVLRNGQPMDFTMTRATIRMTVAEGQLLEGNIGYVKINNFNNNCAEETIAAVEALLDQGAEKLIFDVRNNPGGYVAELVEILDFLLPEGVLFRSVSYSGYEEIEESDADCLELPMAVLVNGSSYSAAEFFAAALREYQWAAIVGEPTVGKGYFQNTLELGDGSAVGLSVGKYYTPNGVSLGEEGGLAPDIAVEVDAQTAALIYAGMLEAMEDPQILAAIEKLN